MKINEMSGCNLIGFASSLAIFISQDLSTEDINILAAFFTALEDNLAILGAVPQNNQQNENENNENIDNTCDT